MVLCFDIETSVPGLKPDPNKDIFKFIGLYEWETNEYHFFGIEDKKKIIEIFKRHRVIVGFNSKFYDEPIMKRSGLWKFRHCHLDIREIVKKRAKLLGCEYESMSLANLANVFKLKETKIKDFDYDILKQDSWTEIELEYIKEYTMQDIEVTKQMFDKIESFFKPLESFMSEYDSRNYNWLTTSISSYAYKVICFMVGLKEEYNHDIEHKTYDGGFVAYPIKTYEKDDIYCLDFNSLYPHNTIQGNLYSTHCNCCKEEEKWRGNDMFKLQGAYCSKKQGKIEKVIQEIYNMRKKLKSEGNRLEYALKIVINTIYGLMGNPVFKNLYNYNGASDCTKIGRACFKYASDKFKNAGYEVLYGDTDSVYVKDHRKDKKMLMMIKDSIIKDIKANLQFQSDTFDMGVDAEIKHIWFFKTGDIFKKKHYMYVENNGTLVIKGLSMIKNDSSKIGYYIFNKYMKKDVINGNINFTYEQVKKWVYYEIDKDLNIVARKFKVWDDKSYKMKNQIQAQISRKYGVGTHILIPNKKIGVGKGIKYCTIEEFRNSKSNLYLIRLDKMWSELKIFISDFPKYNIDPGQENMMKWVDIK